jgi:hypothetical protein
VGAVHGVFSHGGGENSTGQIDKYPLAARGADINANNSQSTHGMTIAEIDFIVKTN